MRPCNKDLDHVVAGWCIGALTAVVWLGVALIVVTLAATAGHLLGI